MTNVLAREDRDGPVVAMSSDVKPRDLARSIHSLTDLVAGCFFAAAKLEVGAIALAARTIATATKEMDRMAYLPL
jgi:hypothetical protein